jgi:hypothetical protein
MKIELTKDQVDIIVNEHKSNSSNSGDRNSGNLNTGNFNSGDRNSGNFNSGNFNSGDRNSGNLNTGNLNTGNLNTGNWNSGNWNSGNGNTGFFNTNEPVKIRVFNKKCLKEVWDQAIKPTCLYFSLIEWIEESAMSEQEKKDHPNYSLIRGYFKKYEFKERFTWSINQASKEDRDLIRALPNFDDDIFLEISGVDLRLLDN